MSAVMVAGSRLGWLGLMRLDWAVVRVLLHPQRLPATLHHTIFSVHIVLGRYTQQMLFQQQ